MICSPVSPAGRRLTGAIDGGSEAAWNVGGGVDYFLWPRLAIRVDVRDYVDFQFSPPPPTIPGSNYIPRSHLTHVWSVRGGLVVRP